MKKEKTKWAKGVNRDEAYLIGFHSGVRHTFELMAKEHAIEDNLVAILFEREYLKEIKDLSEK